MSRSRSLHVFPSVAALAIAAAAARADGPYDLKLHLLPDQQWTFDQTSHMNMQVGVGPPGGQQMQQAADQKRAGTVTILAAQDGVPSAIQVAFAPDCGQTATQNNQPQTVPFALAGKTVRIRKGDLGIVQIDGAATDPATTNELQKMLTPDRSLFPPHPVNVGDEWAGDAAGMAKEMGLGPDDSVVVKCKLVRIDAVAGRPTADVSVDVVGTKTENGVATKMTLTGTAQADLATGQTLQADITGTLDISGQTNTPNGPQPVQGDGKLETHQTVRPTGGPPAPVPLAPTPVPPGPVVASDSDRFAGTFKNEKITVDLHPTASGDLAGTITMAAQQFPADARVQAGQLAGQFTSNGTPFKFTASVDGTTMQLTSGQNTFSLQKDVPAAMNPLDAAGGGGPAPVNPLGR